MKSCQEPIRGEDIWCKYAEEELELLYKALRDDFHIEGYYDGSLGFDEVSRDLDRLSLYIQKIEEIKTEEGK